MKQLMMSQRVFYFWQLMGNAFCDISDSVLSRNVFWNCVIAIKKRLKRHIYDIQNVIIAANDYLLRNDIVD